MSQQEDETTITEISIGPDGRVYVFGASPDVLGVLMTVTERDPELAQRVAQLKQQRESRLDLKKESSTRA